MFQTPPVRFVHQTIYCATRRLILKDADGHVSEQEGRTETVGIAVTPSELELVRLYRLVRKPEGGISGALRLRSLADVLTEAEEIRARLADAEAA